MSIDLSKLTPAAWWVENENGDLGSDGSELPVNVLVGDQEDRVCQCNVGECEPVTNAAFIALARNAFDVAMRRGWGFTGINGHYWPIDPQEFHHVLIEFRGHFAGLSLPDWPDPFTALTEADKWMEEREVAKGGDHAAN